MVLGYEDTSRGSTHGPPLADNNRLGTNTDTDPSKTSSRFSAWISSWTGRSKKTSTGITPTATFDIEAGDETVIHEKEKAANDREPRSVGTWTLILVTAYMIVDTGTWFWTCAPGGLHERNAAAMRAMWKVTDCLEHVSRERDVDMADVSECLRQLGDAGQLALKWIWER